MSKTTPMNAVVRIAVAVIMAAANVAAQERENAVTALELLKSFEPSHHIDRNPDRKLVPKGETMLMDGGTRITIVRAKDGRKIAVSYYGMNRQVNSGRDGLLSFCKFSDEGAYGKPSFRLKRGSEEEALLAKILLSLPLRREYPELKGIVVAQKKKLSGDGKGKSGP